MSSKRYFYMLTGCFAFILLLIIGATIGGNYLLQKQSKKLLSLKVENKAVESQQTALVQAKKDIDKYSDLLRITKSVVPQDKDQAKTVREIVNIASTNSIQIKSVTFESSNLGGSSTSAPAANSGGQAAPASQTPAATAQPPISQLKPVQGIPGVYTLDLQVASDGDVAYQDFLKFLEKLEKNRRTAHVTAITLNPSQDGKRVKFNLTLSAYVKP